MGTKVKGSIIKGFKYISNIFDDKEEEEVMQIGAPTDVKHVAHIGMDDTSATKPSWMEEYKAAPELAPQNNTTSEGRSASIDSDDSKQKPPKDSKHARRNKGSSEKNKEKETSRFRRKSKESNNIESTSEESAAGAVVQKQSRRKKKTSSGNSEGSNKSSKGDHSTSKSLPDSTTPAFPDNIVAGSGGSTPARRRGMKSAETPSTVLEVYD